MSDWYCNIDGVSSGPYSLEELRFLRDRGKLAIQDAVRRGADGAWTSANSFSELFPRTPITSIATIDVQSVTSPVSQVAEPQVTEPETQEEETGPARPPLPPLASYNHRRTKQILLGSTIGAAIAILILMLLMWFVEAGGNRGTLAGRGVGQGTGTGNGTAVGDGGGESQGDDEVRGENDVQEQSTDASEASPNALDQQSTPNEIPQFEIPPEMGFSVNPLQAPPAKATGSGGAGGGESGDGPGTEKTIGGVKVKGAIALVCDISGSMAEDFPVLVSELRRKFPRDTPLILVNGCQFNAPNASNLAPQKATALPFFHQMQMPYLQVLTNDKHVFYGDSTTDAIIFAVEELGRPTVMFNNDLQDGGSELAIDAFEELRKKHKFTLSGRSLNCDAPNRLLKFIEESGGDFKVDTIGRMKMPAIPWSR